MNAYANQVINGQMCVWLQRIGFCPAVQAKDLVIGDVLVWNYGATSTITRFIKDTPKSRFLEVKASGKLYTRRLRKDTYVAIGTHKPQS